MNENYPFTGTGSLYNFCMGLCRINIQNNIIAIFDNDTAGLEKISSLANLARNQILLLLLNSQIIKSFLVFAHLALKGVLWKI